MKILVTGANGFVGSYLCQRISQANKVIGVDYSPRNPVLSALPNFSWHKVDLSKGLSIPDDIDIIVHTAARTPAPKVTTADYVASNVVATQKLIKFALQKKVRALIYLSAISIYGRISSAIVDEETPINQPTPYGMTKYIGELLVREKGGVLPSIVLRLPLVIGAGIKSGWLFETYEKLRKGEPVPIYNGDSPYNMVHISDVYELVLSILGHNTVGSSMFTVSCQDFMSIRQIADTMKQYTHSTSEIV
jgi:UDP-glucose 4-epimerase